jgi:hypothetical protein
MPSEECGGGDCGKGERHTLVRAGLEEEHNMTSIVSENGFSSPISHKPPCKMPAKLLAIALVLLLATASSGPGLGGYLSRHNDEIDNELRKAIHKLNDRIVESLRKNDPSVILAIFVDEVKQQKGIESNVKQFYSQLQERLKNRKFDVYNEYFVVLKKVGTWDFLVPSETDDKFVMHLRGTSEQMYISLLRSQGDFEDLLLAFIYVKVADEWRLHSLDPGVIGIAGKTALEWFEEAKGLAKKGHYVPALLRLQVAGSCMRPAPFFQYEKQQEMAVLARDTQAQFAQTHKFPLRLSGAESLAEIYYIEPQFVKKELLPLIKYVTKIPLDDVPALQEEVNAMTAQLESTFPGITKGSTHIAYQAFSEPPTDPTKQYQFYGLTAEIE